VWIKQRQSTSDAPFGGFKESGLGREGWRFGMEEYTAISSDHLEGVRPSYGTAFTA